MKLISYLKDFFKNEESEKGQAIVEFALTMPLLLVILCGILDFGWIYVNDYQLEHAAYTGARYVTIHAAEQTSAELEANVKAAIAGNLPQGGEGDISLTVDDDEKQVTILIDYPVKTLTFVAGTIFGSYYNASFTNVACY